MVRSSQRKERLSGMDSFKTLIPLSHLKIKPMSSFLLLLPSPKTSPNCITQFSLNAEKCQVTTHSSCPQLPTSMTPKLLSQETPISFQLSNATRLDKLVLPYFTFLLHGTFLIISSLRSRWPFSVSPCWFPSLFLHLNAGSLTPSVHSSR